VRDAIYVRAGRLPRQSSACGRTQAAEAEEQGHTEVGPRLLRQGEAVENVGKWFAHVMIPAAAAVCQDI